MDSSHFQQAAALVTDARARLARVEDKQQRSSPSPRALRSVVGPRDPDELVREVEHIARQLRTALDLTAMGLFLLYGRTARGRVTAITFPILALGDPAKSWSEVLERALPGVAAARPDVARVVAKHQHSSGPDATWLALLANVAEAAAKERLRNREELERAMGGAPIVPMLRRMVTKTQSLVTELRGLTMLRA